MNILIESSQWSPEPRGGGVASSVHTLVNALSKNHSVTVLVPRWSQKTLIREEFGKNTIWRRRIRCPVSKRALPVKTIVMWFLDLPRTLRDLRWIFREHQIEIIHLYQLQASHATIAVARMLGGPPYVATFHGRDVRDYPNRHWLQRALIRFVAGRASRFTAVSPSLAELAQYLIPGVRNVHVIKNGVTLPDPQSIDPPGGLSEPLPSKYFISVGRLYPLDDFALKGQDLLIRAWERLGKAFPDLHLIMAGNDEDRGGYENLAEACDVSAKIHILGRLPRPQLLSIMKGALGLVTASRSEGDPMAILEAGSLRLPVIASNIPAHAGNLCDEVDSLLVPSEDIEGVARAVTRLMGDPALGRRLGQALCQKVHNTRSAEKMAADYVADAYAPALELEQSQRH